MYCLFQLLRVLYVNFIFSGIIDLTLVSWIILFLCRNLEHTSLNNEEKGACAKSSGTVL